jgi:hypothetical protein
LIIEENIKLISGESMCVIFDEEFDSYISERGLAIKAADDISKRHFEKVGFIEEDIRNILRRTVQM